MLPPGLFKNVNKTMAGYAYLLNSLRVTVDEYLENPALLRKADHETIYHHLLPESVDPAQWPSKQSLVNEVCVSAMFRNTGIDVSKLRL